MRLVTDLEPAMLNRLAEDGYALHRDSDLAHALAAGPRRTGQARRSSIAGADGGGRSLPAESQ
jgi:hypothetical protein